MFVFSVVLLGILYKFSFRFLSMLVIFLSSCIVLFMIYRKVQVVSIISSNSEVFEVNTRVVDEFNSNNARVLKTGSDVKVFVYRSIVPTVNIGDVLLVEATAVAKKLGTGGYAFAVMSYSCDFSDTDLNVGHIVKARYTPLQHMVMSLDEQDSPCHDLIKDNSSVEGLPVVVADLHSSLPTVIAGIRYVNPDAKVVYVMTDGAALPIAFSKNVVFLKELGWIYKTITCGQAYGGDGETINIYNALLAAKHVYNADVVVVSQGPGNAGTGTPFGFSGMQCADVFHAVKVLGGVPIGVLRLSNGDLRQRHFGVSHHFITTVAKACFVPVRLPVPVYDGGSVLDEELVSSGFDDKCKSDLDIGFLESVVDHDFVEVSTVGGYECLSSCPVKLSTMGRGLDKDFSAFVAGFVSGKYAASFIV